MLVCVGLYAAGAQGSSARPAKNPRLGPQSSGPEYAWRASLEERYTPPPEDVISKSGTSGSGPGHATGSWGVPSNPSANWNAYASAPTGAAAGDAHGTRESRLNKTGSILMRAFSEKSIEDKTGDPGPSSSSSASGTTGSAVQNVMPRGPGLSSTAPANGAAPKVDKAQQDKAVVTSSMASKGSNEETATSMDSSTKLSGAALSTATVENLLKVARQGDEAWKVHVDKLLRSVEETTRNLQVRVEQLELSSGRYKLRSEALGRELEALKESSTAKASGKSSKTAAASVASDSISSDQMNKVEERLKALLIAQELKLRREFDLQIEEVRKTQARESVSQKSFVDEATSKTNQLDKSVSTLKTSVSEIQKSLQRVASKGESSLSEVKSIRAQMRKLEDAATKSSSEVSALQQSVDHFAEELAQREADAFVNSNSQRDRTSSVSGSGQGAGLYNDARRNNRTTVDNGGGGNGDDGGDDDDDDDDDDEVVIKEEPNRSVWDAEAATRAIVSEESSVAARGPHANSSSSASTAGSVRVASTVAQSDARTGSRRTLHKSLVLRNPRSYRYVVELQQTRRDREPWGASNIQLHPLPGSRSNEYFLSLAAGAKDQPSPVLTRGLEAVKHFITNSPGLGPAVARAAVSRCVYPSGTAKAFAMSPEDVSGKISFRFQAESLDSYALLHTFHIKPEMFVEPRRALDRDVVDFKNWYVQVSTRRTSSVYLVGAVPGKNRDTNVAKIRFIFIVLHPNADGPSVT
ncbi:Hypothetical Protein FCC1311_031532 [Hondaea fermentalgiana]|uniref:Uncharacterized protein n=1 Tax=Hondaea fermentalgiana TaxID=2315210 RepID=A0A2R5G7F4_9STRA|nr:Hypothetical Protein FCC1311_031532 [Hondaea fermentalgiana]|eukprot:GBG26930.1 Hypothetical Protein FCC1311_031532 [Hondaea fermentalgiana]